MPTLRPLTEEELASWMEAQSADYITERVGAGDTEEEAQRVATEQYASVFSDGRPVPGHLFSRVMDGDDAVGWLWIGPRSLARPEAFWVWNVVIDEAYRGRGFGRTAMHLAEEQAREQGAREIGLNVFGHNKIARSLYEKLGYEVSAMQMRKPLSGKD